MANRPVHLKAAYSGYLQGDLPSEDAELTHVGRGTPGGEYLRRFWQPVGYSHELKDLPLPVRVLGEDLVLFRDGSGQVGLLERHCSHRGTSLEFGRISARGIRCCYHGWLYDVDGRILETPGEPPDSTYKDRLYHGAYPIHEYQGLIFAYLGPPDRRPAFPIYDVWRLPGYRLAPGPKVILDYNWLQYVDNMMDPIHTVFLHTTVSGAQFSESFAVVPLTEWQETPIGMCYIDSRRVGDNIWVRIADFVLPNIDIFPETDEDGTEEKFYGPPKMTAWAVPIDDTNTMKLSFLHINDDDPKDWDELLYGARQTAARPYEERQRHPVDYDAQAGQRPIAIHALEHLGATDRGVIMSRKLLRQGIRAVRKGEDPQGVAREPGGVIPTRCRNTILRIPPAADPGAEEALLRATARKVAAGHYPKPAPAAAPTTAG